MAITRYTFPNPTVAPWRDLQEMSNRLAQVFDEGLDTRAMNGVWAPAVNVEEASDALTLTAELPGLTEKDISIDLENNVLTISGEKSETRTEGDEERRYHVWERRFGAFQRRFTLPRSVSAEDIRATFDNGILQVRLPKAPEAKGRKISVERVTA